MEGYLFVFLFEFVDFKFFPVDFVANFNGLIELFVTNEPLLFFCEFAEPGRSDNIFSSVFVKILVLFFDKL